MNADGLDGAELNYWLAWVLGESLETLRIAGDKCSRSDGTTVEYVNDPMILAVFLEKQLFRCNQNDVVTFNGHAGHDERFTAEIRRPEGSCTASGPSPVIAISRAVVAFAQKSREPSQGVHTDQNLNTTPAQA